MGGASEAVTACVSTYSRVHPGQSKLPLQRCEIKILGIDVLPNPLFPTGTKAVLLC
jgi:hypothetical protein